MNVSLGLNLSPTTFHSGGLEKVVGDSLRTSQRRLTKVDELTSSCGLRKFSAH